MKQVYYFVWTLGDHQKFLRQGRIRPGKTDTVRKDSYVLFMFICISLSINLLNRRLSFLNLE